MYFTILPFPAWATDYFVKTPQMAATTPIPDLTGLTQRRRSGGHGNGQRDDNIKVAAGTYNEKIVFPDIIT